MEKQLQLKRNTIVDTAKSYNEVIASLEEQLETSKDGQPLVGRYLDSSDNKWKTVFGVCNVKPDGTKYLSTFKETIEWKTF